MEKLNIYKVDHQQQGDVKLIAVCKPKGKLTRIKNWNMKVELGEATGHAHRVELDTGVEIEAYLDEKGTMFMKPIPNKDGVYPTMSHEEHGTQILNPTRYNEAVPGADMFRKRIVDEYDWEQDATRKVID